MLRHSAANGLRLCQMLQEQSSLQSKDQTWPVFNLDGKRIGEQQLPGTVFDVPIRRDILQRVVQWQLARRQQFKGGGVVHGPVPRPHAYKLNRKVVRLGLQCALSAKAAEGRLHLVDTLLLREAKTQALDKHLNALLAGAPQLNPERPRRSVLLVDSGKQAPDGGDSIRQAAGNLPWVDVIPSEGLNVYSILQRDQLLMTAQAVQLLTQRVQQPIKR
eukprot:jgi/Astpho2/877/Aster-x0973